MPRRSAASFSVPSLTGVAARLNPPPDLIGKAREVFLDTVGSLKPGHFVPSDRPLLVEFCRAAALASEADAALAAEGAVIETERGRRTNPWIIIQEKSVRAMAALSVAAVATRALADRPDAARTATAELFRTDGVGGR